jgi:hypothetical protein
MDMAMLILAVCTRVSCMRHLRGRYFPQASIPGTVSVNDAFTAAFDGSHAITLPVPLYMPRDMQVERMLSQTLDCETFMLRCFLAVFRDCKAGHSFFVDSGANEGLWSLLAASFGCRVLSVEPQPGCAALVQRGVHLNNLTRRIHVINRALAPQAIA